MAAAGAQPLRPADLVNLSQATGLDADVEQAIAALAGFVLAGYALGLHHKDRWFTALYHALARSEANYTAAQLRAGAQHPVDYAFYLGLAVEVAALRHGLPFQVFRLLD
jgi:hypothetical protein